MNRTGWRAGVVLSLLITSSLIALPAGAEGARPAARSAQSQNGVSPNTYLNDLFNEYGNSAGCADWSGADGTQSIKLPSGKRAWFFSDSYLGAVQERPGFYKSFIRNAIVMQSGDDLRTITGGNTCRERDHSIPFWERYAKTPVVDPLSDQAWYWSGDSKVIGSNVVKFYYRNVAQSRWWIETHTGIATIPISDLETKSVLNVAPTFMDPQPSFGDHPIIWGASLLDSGGYTYIYGWGVTDSNNNKKLYLARVAPANLSKPSEWQYNTGDGQNKWSAKGNQAAARPVSAGLHVEAGFSVASIGGKHWLIQHEPDLDGGRIVAHPATRPWNFTSSRVALYTPPEGPRDADHKHQFYYEARLHPQLSTDSTKVVVSYNVNTSAVSIGCRSRNDYDGAIYRPRFLDVPKSAFNAKSASSISAASARSASGKRKPQDGRGVRQVPLKPPAGVPAHSTRRSALADDGDLTWYDQWSAPVVANHDCPRLDSVTSLDATARPDGSVSLDWNSYGRDIWYWLYRRDVTADGPFRKHDLWTTVSSAQDFPVLSRDDNGHQFGWYVVPFASADAAVDRNGDGKLDNEAPSSNTVDRIARLELPAAATNVTYSFEGPSTMRINWTGVTYPSDKVFYWIYACSPLGGPSDCRKAGPFSDSVRSATLGGVDATFPWSAYVYAENLAGVGPDAPAERVDPPPTLHQRR